jgi:hypothetical protein
MPARAQGASVLCLVVAATIMRNQAIRVDSFDR